MQYQDQTFAGTIELDGNEFIRCVFEGGATVTYAGGQPPVMVDCDCYCAVQFIGPALSTVETLQAWQSHKSGMTGQLLGVLPTLAT